MNDKAKAIFFAQYIYQDVYNYNGWGENDTQVLRCDWIENNQPSSRLILRSVEQLTDDELITIASIVCARHNRHYQPEDITYKISQKRRYDIFVIVKGVARYTVQLDSDGIGFVDYYMGGSGHIHHYAPAQFAVTDYLRSIGMLLPFTYLNEDNKPITLSPNEIIKLGWAKYKS